MDIAYSPQTRRNVVGFLALAAPLGAWAADCSRQARPLALPDRSPDDARLRYYDCSMPGGGELTVQFVRLNDLLAGILLSGKSPEALPDLSRNASFVDNEVLREYRRITTTFGENVALSRITELTESGPETTSQSQPESLQLERIPYSPRTLGLLGVVDYPEATALKAMTTRHLIPPGYRTIDERSIYRAMTKADIDGYEANVAAYNLLIADERSWYPSKRFRTDVVHRSMRLLKELAAPGWPRDFVHIFGHHDHGGGCGGAKNSWQFSYSPRDILLEVAVLAAGSKQAVAIESIVGKRWTNERLRNAATAVAEVARPPGEILALNRSLVPGHKLIVPTRIIWTSDEISHLPEDAQAAIVRQYLWGPEWQIDGVRAGGQTAYLEGRAANFLGITTSTGEGSCPYLSVWDPDLADWVNTGKILEDADHAEAEQCDWRRVSGLVTRFKLAELEAEVAVIRGVELILVLKTGATVAAMPRGSCGHATQFRLDFGDETELEFDLPAGIAAKDVAASELRLTGFYERYGDVLAGVGSRRQLHDAPTKWESQEPSPLLNDSGISAGALSDR